jgi:hypothetical protein
MAMGCLAALFGIGLNSSDPRSVAPNDDYDMGEGEIHSGPGGYEGMGYTGGYAAKYLARNDNSSVGAADAEPEESWADLDEGEEA